MNETAALPLTEAQRFLAENTDRLQRDVDIRKETLRSEADTMTKDEIREALEQHNANSTDRYRRVNAPSRTAPKTAYVEAFVKLHLNGSDEVKALGDAREAAREDEAVDAAMQGLVERRTAALAKVRDAMAYDTDSIVGNALVSHLEWHADDLQTILFAARIADVYLAARAERSMEPKVLAHQIARNAVQKIGNAVQMSSNLRMDAHGLNMIAEAQAHRILLDRVRRLLPPAALDVVGWL